uniref:Uncharacterized protein n=1 Tax=Arundo donax TaxID=35708 RepID=A0A0A9F015_ARUDO
MLKSSSPSWKRKLSTMVLLRGKLMTLTYLHQGLKESLTVHIHEKVVSALIHHPRKFQMISQQNQI